MKKRILPVAFLLCIVGFMCLAEEDMRSLRDCFGKTVMVPGNVTRVAANGALNQIVFMLGGGDKLVATSAIVQRNPMFVKLYPRLAELPAPFGTDLKSLNFEVLLSANPQVVFGSFEQLKASDIAQVELRLTNPDEIKKTILLVGQVLGPAEEKRAHEFIDYYNNNIARITARTSALPREKRPAVYLASGKDGLNSEGKKSIVNFWIESGGGRNIAASYIDMSGTLVLETIIAENPSVIIAMTKTLQDEILTDPKWAAIDAVRNSRVYTNPKGVYLWAVRSAEGSLQMLWAAKTIQPELFEDLDMEEELSSYYKDYYGYTLSEEEISSILFPEA